MGRNIHPEFHWRGIEPARETIMRRFIWVIGCQVDKVVGWGDGRQVGLVMTLILTMGNQNGLFVGS